MEEFKVTKTRILDAASKCSTAAATLKVLFPEAFEVPKKTACSYTVGEMGIETKEYVYDFKNGDRVLFRDNSYINDLPSNNGARPRGLTGRVVSTDECVYVKWLNHLMPLNIKVALDAPLKEEILCGPFNIEHVK